MIEVQPRIERPPLVLHLPPAIKMTREQFFDFCQLNPELRIERTAEGDIIIMPPAQLGWLIDPEQRRVYVYRPATEVEQLDNPTEVSGDPVLPGLVLDLTDVWERPF